MYSSMVHVVVDMLDYVTGVFMVELVDGTVTVWTQVMEAPSPNRRISVWREVSLPVCHFFLLSFLIMLSCYTYF
jgi:hypothetical protein